MSRTSYNCILARHTETDWNVQDRHSGQSNQPALTALGIVQALGLASRFTGSSYTAPTELHGIHGITKIVCSDLRRAVHTALIVAAHLGGPVPILDSRLRELSVGQMDGLTKTEALQRFTDPYFSTRHPDYDFRAIGGECRAGVIRRYHEAFQEHIGFGGVCLIVGHGTALRTLLEDCGVTTPIGQGGFVPLLYPSKILDL